ncbi:MAG: LLM class flavin-dependent oxidoreductase, partial [Acidimicrobiia bacterium]|nr:LLM class flavin-dependent oxidoreductase [Acidimicrobiia bacterium]
MEFSFGFPLMAHPQNPEFLTAEAIAEFARAAEAAEFDSCSLTEHPLPSDRWLASGGHDALDPFVALAVAAGATTRLRLLTNLTPLPYRNPAILAKTVATLDRLSGGRAILGAGVGYLE